MSKCGWASCAGWRGAPVGALAIGMGALLGVVPEAQGQIGRGGQSIDNPFDLKNTTPEQIEGLTVVQRLGQKVPLDLRLIDSDGTERALGEWFKNGKPVLMVLVYFRCPMQCPLTLQRLTQKLREIEDWQVGREFNVVVVSFDPTETAKDAAARKFEWVTSYGRAPTAQVEAGWAFLTSPVEGRVRELADAVGFQYRYLPASNEYAHPTAFYALTSDGVISRYLSGLDGSSKEMRLALFDAGEGKIGGVLDTFWQMCFTFDAHAGSYTLQAFRVMQIGAVGCVALVGGVVGSMLLVERRRRLARAAQAASGVAGAVGGVATINKGAPAGAPAGAV